MADRKMNEFALVRDAAYLYGEGADGNQVKIEKEGVMQNIGLWRKYFRIIAGRKEELPYSSGLIIAQVASFTHGKAIGVVQGNNTGALLQGDPQISFFSDTPGKICVLNQGENTCYIVKNNFGVDVTVSVIFIGI